MLPPGWIFPAPPSPHNHLNNTVCADALYGGSAQHPHNTTITTTMFALMPYGMVIPSNPLLHPSHHVTLHMATLQRGSTQHPQTLV